MQESRNDTATILLVEDDITILDGMADLLRIFDIGYQVDVVKASDGEEGLESMRLVTPDLIISDIMMPRLNGFEFLNIVRENPAWVHIPFIFLTAKGKKQDIMQGRRSGAELYITKPFVSAELLELVKSQLDRTFQLQQARQQRLGTLKRNLLQLLNHEFRTPLTYVTAYYDMLAESIVSVEDPSNLQEYLRGIQVGCVRLTNLVEDLIKIMEIRTGKAAAAFREQARPLYHLGKLIRERGEQIEASAARSGIRVDYDIGADLPGVFGDPAALSDAIDRLLDNALKFTQAKRDGPRQITLSADVYNDWVRVSVKDSGVGFPAHVQKQLFDLFFQYNRERLEQQGSGSGLAIAKGLIDLHHGKIEVQSDASSGSVFTIFLPLYDERTSQTITYDEARRRQATILVVEDDKHLLEGLRELMEMAQGPYELRVLTASNGQEGLKLLERYQPDLIISDVMMPIMGGYEFLKRVRSSAAWLQIPFIFLTAKGEREDVHRGRRSGAEEYITKPYDIDDLMSLTVTQLDRFFQRQGAMNQSFEALKRSILSMLQPDFKNPLDMVTSYSEKLAGDLENIQTEEDLYSSLHGIQASSERLTQLVEDFIAMAEFRTGEAQAAFRMRAVPEKNVSMLLHEAGYVLQFDRNIAGVEFTYELNNELPPVLCERGRLQNIFIRLINFFIDARDAERVVRLYLTSFENDDQVCLTIRAGGVNFAPEWMEQITSFLSSREESILELSDVGPTLTVIKSVVVLHDGFIEIDETNDNEIIVRITFPIFQLEPAGLTG